MRRWMSDNQRKAMFASMTNPYVVTGPEYADRDRDGVSIVPDINPLGNMAMGTGLQIFGRPGSVNSEDRDHDGVNDLFDVNPDGSIANGLEDRFLTHPLVVPVPKYDFGDRFASKLTNLYKVPSQGRVPLEERMKYFGDGLVRKVTNFYNIRQYSGVPLETRAAHLGDKFANKLISLYPSRESVEGSIYSKSKRLGDRLGMGISGLYPGVTR